MRDWAVHLYTVHIDGQGLELTATLQCAGTLDISATGAVEVPGEIGIGELESLPRASR